MVEKYWHSCLWESHIIINVDEIRKFMKDFRNDMLSSLNDVIKAHIAFENGAFHNLREFLDVSNTHL